MASQYETIRSQSKQILEDITLNPKPSYSIDGQHFEHAEYLQHLIKTIQFCDLQIAAENPTEIATRTLNA